MIFIQRSAGRSDSIVQTNNFNQRRKGNLGGQNCSKSEHEYIHGPNIVKTCFTCKRYTVKSHAWENQQHACYCTFRRAKFDTTLCPAAEMMWLRTSLVSRNGQGWELLEFSEPVSELEKMEGDIYDSESDFASFDTCSCPLRAQRGLWFQNH